MMGKVLKRIFVAALAFLLIKAVVIQPLSAQTEAPTSTVTCDQAAAEPCPEVPSGPSREELETLIKTRADELERINRELETTQENLRNTKDQKATLEREVRSLDYNVQQLQLSIQSDEITAQKLELEIASLNYDIRDIELSVEAKRNTIGHVLRELQLKDRDNLLTVFLKNDSLADGVFEAQALTNLRSQLGIDIASLRALREQLDTKVSDVSEKKTGVETHKKNLAVRKVIVQDQKEQKKVVLTQTQNKETVYTQQVEGLQKQQLAIADEIDAIETQLREKFDVSILPVKRPNVFTWPVQLKSDGGKGLVTQHFGERSRLYGGKPHNGLDIGAPIGTEIYAADDGVVFAVDNNDQNTWRKYQYGKYVLIRHSNNLMTLYAHLSKQSVQKGETVRRGQIVGYVGATGYATGAHLHFGVYWAPSIEMKSIPPAAGKVPVGVGINPEDYL